MSNTWLHRYKKYKTCNIFQSLDMPWYSVFILYSRFLTLCRYLFATKAPVTDASPHRGLDLYQEKNGKWKKKKKTWGCVGAKYCFSYILTLHTGLNWLRNIVYIQCHNIFPIHYYELSLFLKNYRHIRLFHEYSLRGAFINKWQYLLFSNAV